VAATVVVNFKMGGGDAVLKSIRSISTSAQREAVRQVQASNAVTRARVAGSAKEEQAASTAATRKTKEDERAAAAADKAGQKRVAAATKAADQEVRAAERAAREIARIEERQAQESARLLSRKVKENTRAFNEMAKAAESSKWLGKGVGRATLEGAGQGFRSGAGVLAAGAGLVGGAVGTAGIMSAVQGAVALEQQIAGIAADVQDSNGTIDQTAYKKRIQNVAGATGIGSEDIAKGLEAASAQGGGRTGLEAFAQNLEKIGELSLASGTKMEDLAAISAALTNNQITGAEDQLAIMRDVNAAAKTGNINLRELGPGIAAIMGSIKAGGFNVADSTRHASALAQIAKAGGASSSEDATTAAKNFFNDLATHQKNLKALGVTTTSKDGRTRVDAVTQFKELMGKTGGDLNKINAHGQMFGMQSQPLVGALMAAYSGKNTDLVGKDGKTVLSGNAAVDALVAKFAGSKMSDADVSKDANLRRNTTGGQLSMTMEKFKAQVGNDLLPVLAKMTPQFAQLAGAIGSLVKFVAESPGKALAGFLALNTAVGALQGVIGKVGGNLMDKLFSSKTATMSVQAGVVHVGGKGITPGSTPGAPPPGSNVAKYAAALGGVLVGAEAGREFINSDTGSIKASSTNTSDLLARAINARGEVKSGDPAEMAKAAQTRKELQARIINAEAQVAAGGGQVGLGRKLFEGALNTVSAGNAGRSTEQINQTNADIQNLGAMKDELARLNGAMTRELSVRVVNANEMRAPGRDPASQSIVDGGGGLWPGHHKTFSSCTPTESFRAFRSRSLRCRCSSPKISPSTNTHIVTLP